MEPRHIMTIVAGICALSITNAILGAVLPKLDQLRGLRGKDRRTADAEPALGQGNPADRTGRANRIIEPALTDEQLRDDATRTKLLLESAEKLSRAIAEDHRRLDDIYTDPANLLNLPALFDTSIPMVSTSHEYHRATDEFLERIDAITQEIRAFSPDIATANEIAMRFVLMEDIRRNWSSDIPEIMRWARHVGRTPLTYSPKNRHEQALAELETYTDITEDIAIRAKALDSAEIITRELHPELTTDIDRIYGVCRTRLRDQARMMFS